MNVVMFLSAVILVYSGVKGYKPQTVLSWALGGPKPTGWDTPKKKSGPYGGQLGGGPGNPKTGGNGVAPGDHPGDAPWSYGSGNGSSDASAPGNLVNPIAGGIVSV